MGNVRAVVGYHLVERTLSAITKCHEINGDEVDSHRDLITQDQILVSATNLASWGGEVANHINHSC